MAIEAERETALILAVENMRESTVALLLAETSVGTHLGLVMMRLFCT